MGWTWKLCSGTPIWPCIRPRTAPGERFFSIHLIWIPRALEERDLEYRLRRAIKENEFDLYYQPQINLITRQITGVEALIRWKDPERGFVPPERFIPVAEKCGLIRTIGEWVLKTVCQHNRYWQATGFPPLRFSVNLSGHQLKQPDLLEIVDGTLLDASFLPGSLELELTESIFMAPVDVTVKALRDLKARGGQPCYRRFWYGILFLELSQAFSNRPPENRSVFCPRYCYREG